jgi:sugar fermentation stimulation protein A
MKFTPKLEKATLIKRYKRFLVDLETPNQEFTVHCANTGKMTGCADPGFKAFYSTSDNPKRKYAHSLELTQNLAGDFICVNTAVANKLAIEGIEQGVISELQGYAQLQPEVKYGQENSRIDVLLKDEHKPLCYVEVKSVTLLEDGQGYFPDTQTVRGQKHLRELIDITQQGHRAVLLFMVMHTGIGSVKAATHLDDKYAKLLKEAIDAGVEAIAYNCKISPLQITINKKIPVLRS